MSCHIVYITIVMLLPTGAHLKKWKKWLVQDLKVSQNWPECYTSNTVSSTSREGKANIKWLLSLALSLPEWARGDKSDNAFTAPESLIKRQTCCKKTVCVSIHTDRSTAVEFPHRQFHDRYTASAEYLSGCLTECLGEPRHVGVSTAGSLHTNTLLPIPQGIIGKKCLWMTSSIVASLHSSSLCQRKEEPEQYDQNCRDMSKYNMNFLKTLQLHKSRCIPSLQ